MGSSPRSYGYRFNWGGMLTPAIKILLIANTAVFLVQTLVQLILGPQAHRWLIEWFGLMPRGVTHGLRVWQPFTYLFLHGGLMHLLINMLVLWMFGRAGSDGEHHSAHPPARRPAGRFLVPAPRIVPLSHAKPPLGLEAAAHAPQV